VEEQKRAWAVTARTNDQRREKYMFPIKKVDASVPGARVSSVSKKTLTASLCFVFLVFGSA